MQQYITFSIGKTHEKDFLGPNFQVKAGQNRARSLVFCHFIKFDSLVLLEGGGAGGGGGGKFGRNGPKSDQKLGFL